MDDLTHIVRGEDGSRRKHVSYQGGTKLLKICTGNNNTCEDFAEFKGKCNLCNKGVIRREWLEKYAKGEYFVIDGTRYVRKKSRAKQCCKGLNNTCNVIVKKREYCKKHN